MPGSRVERGAVIEGPCFIGEGAWVRSGARVGAYSVLGAGSVVDRQASVKRAVLWRKARLEAGAQARGCVLAAGAVMGEESAAFEESALGREARLGARSVLPPGVKAWPGKRIADGVRLEANLVWGGSERPGFTNGRLSIGEPAQATRIAQAYASAVRPGNVLIGREASSVALSNMLAAEAGLMAQGVQVLEAGVSALPQLRMTARLLRADGAIFIDGESMRPLDELGAELIGAQRRRMENLLLRQDYERAFAAVTKLPAPAGRSDLAYVGRLLEEADAEALSAVRPRIAVCAPNEQLLGTAECALEKAGCVVRAEWEEEMMELAPGEIGLWLTEGGESMRLAGEDGSLTGSEETLLRVWTLLEKGVRRVILPVSATRTADMLAGGYDAEIVRVKGERSSYMRALAEENRAQLTMQFDGLYAAMQCIGMLARRGLTLNQWLRGMPKLNRRVRSVPVAWQDKGRVLGALLAGEEEPDVTDGMCVCRDGGWAWISPSADRAECRIVTEARRAETAQELCDFYADRIAGALKPKE